MKRLLLAATIALSVSPALARWKPEYAQASPEIRHWFSHQYNAHGLWCCDNADGHRYDEDYSINKDGSVTLADGTVVEEWKVLTGPNPTGHAVLWQSNGYIFCFAPGAMF